jgi:pimeloyl-ACP methyl ester carboxylesterase
MKKIGILCLVLVLALALVFPSAVYAKGCPKLPSYVKPIVFVHGMAGSAQQFESQAMRFASNGWPVDYLFAFEWTAAFPSPETTAERTARLDAFIDSVLAQTGADKIYLMGHSAGTSVSFGYLADPAHAAKVAKYVNIDGMTATALPGGVPTLAIWAEIAGTGAVNPPREIVGATNVLLAGQFHVQSATSAEAFAEMYKFFTGNEPATTDIIPEPPGQVRLAGRAVFFPANQGVGDATLEIWEVDAVTGARKHAKPEATYTLSGTGYYDGTWGPFKANGQKHYEFVLLREGFRPHHFYFEPFMRSDYFVRLQTSPSGGIGEYMDRSDYHSNIVVTRQKELRDADVLEMNGANIVTALAPITKAIIGLFVYDDGADGVSDLTQPIPYYHAITFMSGVDLYMPAAEPPDGTISVVLTPRDGGGKTQVINVPNWASSEHAISIVVNDYVQEFNSWREYVVWLVRSWLMKIFHHI